MTTTCLSMNSPAVRPGRRQSLLAPEPRFFEARGSPEQLALQTRAIPLRDEIPVIWNVSKAIEFYSR